MKSLLTLLQISDYQGNQKRVLKGLQFILGAFCFLFLIWKVSRIDLTMPVIDFMGFSLVLALVIFLMPLNWFLEAERWRYSLPTSAPSRMESIRVVLIGQSLNWGLPFTTGDAVARMLNVGSIKESAFALLVNRSIMLLITGLFGLYAVNVYFQMNGILLFVYLVGFLASFFLWVFFSEKGELNLATIYRIALLSIFRYLVFTLQFYILIKFFNPSLTDLIVLAGIGWVFLFRSLIPALFGNFGVREAGALIFFGSYVTYPALILAPCLLIWFINIVLPSMAGFYALFGLKTIQA